MSFEPVIVVHGGAGTHALIKHDCVAKAAIEDGVKDAARAGHEAVARGRTALDAVEVAVRSLENNPIFNAGRGSCLTICGTVEMDASIMDGRTLRSGAVGCVENIANPISLARLVMDKSDHVLFVGEGAKQFAVKEGVPTVQTEELITDKSRRRLQMFSAFNPSVKVDFHNRTNKRIIKPYLRLAMDPEKDGSHDTVGAVALDMYGNLAYATSTGGINGKAPGRCGDSAIAGSGGYSDNGIGTVSTTGHGESFIKTNIARLVIFHMEQGKSVQEALETSLAYTLDRVGGCGGAIGLTPTGDIGIAFNTEGMSWAYVKGEELRYGIYNNENFQEKP